MWRTWREALGALRDHRWDLAVTFAESFSSALLLRLAGTRHLIGYRGDGRRLLLSKSLPRERLGMRQHLVREYMALALAAGADPCEEVPELSVNDHLAGEAREILSRADLDASGPIVGLCPGAAYGPSKRWPAERFASLGREFASEGAAVAVFGSRSEIPLAGELCGGIPGAASVAGKTSIEELAGCLSLCSVVIANDSGAAHLAAAVGSAVVAIFGSTDASWTRPLGARAVVVKTSELPCAPCFGKECDRGYECLTGISEKQVMAAARAAGGLQSQGGSVRPSSPE
jgi:heptosyltransferase-2